MTMKVKDLLETLQALDPDDLVVCASDGEGNSFAPLFVVSQDMYHPEEQEISCREITDEMRKEGFSDADLGRPEDGYVPCLVLWPEG